MEPRDGSENDDGGFGSNGVCGDDQITPTGDDDTTPTGDDGTPTGDDNANPTGDGASECDGCELLDAIKLLRE